MIVHEFPAKHVSILEAINQYILTVSPANSSIFVCEAPLGRSRASMMSPSLSSFFFFVGQPEFIVDIDRIEYQYIRIGHVKYE